MRRYYLLMRIFLREANRSHISAYASQAAYFFMLSLVPILLLLTMLVQYTSVSQADVLAYIMEIFPQTINTMITSLVEQAYNQSVGFLPVSIVVALWSSCRGVLSLSRGLSLVNHKLETRNYIFLRIRAAFYMLLFLISIILSWVLLVFGNSINKMVEEHFQIWAEVVKLVLSFRVLISVAVLCVVFILVYKYLPNRKETVKNLIPGAVFSAIGWVVVSFGISVYVDVSKGFQDMYGSFTTVALSLLWMYACMYILLIGAQINVFKRQLERKHLDK